VFYRTVTAAAILTTIFQMHSGCRFPWVLPPLNLCLAVQWWRMLSAEVVRAACWPSLPLSVADEEFLLTWTLQIGTTNWTRRGISPFVNWL